MTHVIIKSSDIFNHPQAVMSAEYWVNIKKGRLPFIKDVNGSYVCSHTKDLNKAVYMTTEQASTVNVALVELKKAQELVKTLLKQKE